MTGGLWITARPFSSGSTSCVDDDHLDAALAQPVEVKGLDAIVGDDAVDI